MLWRDRSWPIVFVRHDSADPESPLAVGTPGNAFKDIITGEPDLLVGKTVNSSFHRTPDLHAWLQREGIEQVVICGITTNHCCETTARVAGNLGYDTAFATVTTTSALLGGERPGVQRGLPRRDDLYSVCAGSLGEPDVVRQHRRSFDSQRAAARCSASRLPRPSRGYRPASRNCSLVSGVSVTPSRTAVIST